MKAKAQKRVAPKKKQYMNDETFSELTESLNEALQHARGKRADLRTTILPAPPPPLSKREIVKLRQRLSCSQSVFAAVLNVSIKTVQAWEQGNRVPSDAALRLLSIVDKHPEVLLEA
ncbi:MAG: type II toxin-antitoxin system MqsA family antitoxin [Pyrinomonadaceae bacterium]